MASVPDSAPLLDGSLRLAGAAAAPAAAAPAGADRDVVGASRSVAALCRAAKRAARELAALPAARKDGALRAIADALEAQLDEILAANAHDLDAGRAAGLSAALMDRLRLDEARVRAMADGARAIAALPDPIGEVIDGGRLANGLDVR